MRTHPILLIGILSWSCFAALADDQLEQQPATDEQELLFNELPSVFTASRHEQPTTKAPASVDIISNEQIKRYGWRTVADALGSLPGFITTYNTPAYAASRCPAITTPACWC
jgi:outer membrane receptor for ferrienterochelin and colicins